MPLTRLPSSKMHVQDPDERPFGLATLAGRSNPEPQPSTKKFGVAKFSLILHAALVVRTH